MCSGAKLTVLLSLAVTFLVAWNTLLTLFFAHFSFSIENDGNDETEETDGRRENFNNQDLHEQRGIGGISESGTGAHDTDRETAEEIAKADGEAGAKHDIASKKVFRLCCLADDRWIVRFDVVEHHNGDDDAVDGDGLAEDDRHQVLSTDPRRLHTTADDR